MLKAPKDPDKKDFLHWAGFALGVGGAVIVLLGLLVVLTWLAQTLGGMWW